MTKIRLILVSIIRIICVLIILRVIAYNFFDAKSINFLIIPLIVVVVLPELSVYQSNNELRVAEKILWIWFLYRLLYMFLLPFYYEQGEIAAELLIVGICLFVIEKCVDNRMNQMLDK